MGALEVGAKVGVVSPSDGVRNDRLDMKKSLARVTEDWGLSVNYAPKLFNQVHDFQAGSVTERQGQLLWLANMGIGFSFMAEGGYALGQLFSLPDVRRRTMKLIKRWGGMFMGYSDVGWMACAALKFEMKSIYGPNFAWLHKWDKVTRDMTRAMLMENKVWAIGPEFHWTVGMVGGAEGNVIVGNLEVLTSQFRSKKDWLRRNRDIILCLEENGSSCAEITRNLDRLFAHKHADSIKGIVIGRITEVKNDDYPKYSKHVSLRDEIIGRVRDFSVGRRKIPVAFLDDFGHIGEGYESEYLGLKKRMVPMIFGAKAELTVSKREGCSLNYRDPLWK